MEASAVSSTWTYPLADHLGTIGGNDSFGNGGGGNGFTGRENDTFTGLMHYRARMYDPQLGRFTSKDPTGQWAPYPNVHIRSR